MKKLLCSLVITGCLTAVWGQAPAADAKPLAGSAMVTAVKKPYTEDLRNNINDLARAYSLGSGLQTGGEPAARRQVCAGKED